MFITLGDSILRLIAPLDFAKVLIFKSECLTTRWATQEKHSLLIFDQN